MKRIISLILVILMLVTTLVSCSNGALGEGETTDNTEKAEAAESSESIDTEKETEGEAQTEPALVMREYDLKKYRIIYDNSSNLDSAEELRDKIKEATGVELAISLDSTSDDMEFELIIGSSDREISGECANVIGSPYLNKKGAVSKDGKIQLLGDDVLTLSASIDYFLKSSLVADKTVISVPEKGDICCDIDREEIHIPKKADESYIRLVSNNIRMQSLTKSKERAIGLFAAFKIMDADIYALQEVDALWRVSFGFVKEMEAMGYKSVPLNSTSSTNGPIFYKADKFKVIDSGLQKYDVSMFTDGAYPAAVYLWACLEHRETKKQIIVVNTHLTSKVTHEGVSEEEKLIRVEKLRNETARQLSAAISALERRFSGAVALAAGDFNNNYESKTYEAMKQGLLSARDDCEKKVNMQYNTTLGSGNINVLPEVGTRAIDHIFYSKTGMEAKHYETLVSPYTYAYSDHVPVMLDFELK